MSNIKEYLLAMLRGLKNDAIIKLGIKQYPIVVNYSATNICNCRCQMCNVWKKEHKEKHMMTPEEIKKMFGGKLFKNTTSVGISGGEPFLRNDLPDVVESIINALPSIRSISIISNGLLKDKIIENLPKIISICENRSVDFSIMFSIDGIEETHNKIRGNENAYKNLDQLLKLLDEMSIPYRLCTTIVKSNINELFEILNYAKLKQKSIKFRVATYIERLYNDDLAENYTFTRDEKIKIAKFLEGLIANYELDINQKILYKSIISQLIDNAPRKAGCLWKNKGVSIDPEGNLHYCFAKSPFLGNCLENDGENLYFKNEPIRREIVKKECNNCIHDYTGTHSFKTIFELLKSKIKLRLRNGIGYNLLYYFSFFLTPLLKKRKVKSKINMDTAYITGWYGTETLGDKAILGGIIGNLTTLNPDVKLNISSIVPYFTEETMKMIKSNDNYEVFGKSLRLDMKKIKESDVVIMGGGPLMDITDVNNILVTFMMAKIYKKKTIVWNCGLGPLKNKKLTKIVRDIMQLSDLVMLRDENSAKSYPALVNGINYQVGVDPAVNYLLNFESKEKDKDKESFILFCIRDWPRNYCHNDEEYEGVNSNFLETIVEFIKVINLKYGKEIRFYPMHTYFIGEDDRTFFHDLKVKFGDLEGVQFYNGEYSVNESISIFKKAEMLIGMRFHSVVFGNTLGTPTVAIDYDTKKGKVFGFSQIIANETNCINIRDISIDNLVQKFEEFLRQEGDEFKYQQINNILNGRVEKVSKILSEHIYQKGEY